MAVILTMVVGCANTNLPEAAGSGSGFSIISGNTAKELFESNDGVILLDVRNQDEYEENHIQGSILIPVNELEERLTELTDKDAIIIVYCRSGRRSADAVDILVSSGYTNIYNMQSIDNWP